MKVLHVIPSVGIAHGGPSVVLPILERVLTRAGVDVETVTTDDEAWGSRNDKGDGLPRFENGVIRRYFAKQIEFYKVSMPLNRWLCREVSGFDLVHIHALFSFPSIAAARAARRAGIPYIIRPLGVLNNYGVTQRRAILKRFSLRWVEGPALLNAAAVHFTAEAERCEAESLGIPFKSVVIPLGIEHGPMFGEAKSQSPYVLFLSRIDPKKNLELLLNAWQQAIQGRPGWRLVIAGAGPSDYLDSLIKLCSSLGISKNVEWVGHVMGEDKGRLIAGASVYVLPSHSENFGIAAAEALMAGIACIFTPGVAVGAPAGKAGAAIIVDPDVPSLLAGLVHLMDDSSSRQALGERAAAFASSELSAEIMGQRLKVLYQQVTS